MSQNIFTHVHGLAHVLLLVDSFEWLAFLLCVETSLLPCCALRHAMLRAFSLFSSVPSGKPWSIIFQQPPCVLLCFSLNSLSVPVDSTQRVRNTITECHDKLTVILVIVRSWTVPRTACLQFTRCTQFVEGTRCIWILSSHLAWVGMCLLFA
jgi:hypothetical protein